MKTALLVGGPEHGNVWKMQESRFSIAIRVLDTPVYMSEEISPGSLIPMHTEHYHREIISFFGHYLTVYMHQSIPDIGTTERHQQRGRLIGELLLNDLGKTLLVEGP